MPERPAIRRIIDEPDPVRQLELYAATQPRIWSRVGPLLRVLDAAESSDPSLVELREQISAERGGTAAATAWDDSSSSVAFSVPA